MEDRHTLGKLAQKHNYILTSSNVRIRQ